jgi:hypothetical protein
MLYPNGLTTRPWVTSPYGWRTHPLTGLRRFHYGVDSVDHPDGFNHAPEDGVVTFARYNGGNGYEVRIKGKTREWKLFHHFRIDVKVGQAVRQGARTGPTGTTGASTGVHCHCECWNGAAHQDPFAYIAAHLSGGGASGGGIPADEKEGSHMMFRLILTSEGTSTGTADNVYDMFTDFATITVTHAEAAAYNTMGELAMGHIDGTADASATQKAFVATVRKMWARIQEANLAALAASGGGGGSVPPVDLDALAAKIVTLMPTPPTLEQIAEAVVDETEQRARERLDVPIPADQQ